MRTNIEIDDVLMKEAMVATGAKTKKAAVESALKQMVRLHQQASFRDMWGKFDMEDDLDAQRLSGFSECDTRAPLHEGKVAE